MREIKFRGFCEHENGKIVISVNGEKRKGEWVYGIPVKTKIGIFIIDEENPHYCSQYQHMEIQMPKLLIPGTVSQLTGLRDKKGKEIYDGDIAKCVSELYSGFGKYPTGKFSTTYYEICSIDKNAYCFGERRVGGENIFEGILRNCAKEYYEVIGNIYENPELLEENNE